MAEEKWLGGCEQAKKAFDVPNAKCCISCHDDEGIGVPMCTIFIPGSNDYYGVCCSVANACRDERGTM